MKTQRTIKSRIIIAIALVTLFITTTASSCGSPECDITGPSTMMSTCVYRVVNGE